jgi:hypothetical protein
VLVLVIVMPVFAETRISNNVTGSTFPVGNNIHSFTTTSTSYAYLSVYIKAWGASPNPLKDWKIEDNYWTTSSGTAIIFNFNGWETSRHSYQKLPADPMSKFYTSSTGCQSSSCWFNGNTNCGGTC